MKTEVSISEVIERLAHRQKAARRTLDEFKEKFAQNPASALEWSTGTFEAAALDRLLTKLIHGLTKEIVTVEEILEELRYRVLRTAQFPQRSTSPVSNLMHQADGQASAEMLEFFSDLRE